MQLREYFGPNIVEGVAESWVETGMSWVEVKMSWMGVDGAGWSWVHGLVIPLPPKKKLLSNDFFISPLNLSQIVLHFSNKSSSSIKKIHTFSLSIMIFYTSACFRKHYM